MLDISFWSSGTARRQNVDTFTFHLVLLPNSFAILSSFFFFLGGEGVGLSNKLSLKAPTQVKKFQQKL